MTGPIQPEEICPDCHGAAKIEDPLSPEAGFLSVIRPCHECFGTGIYAPRSPKETTLKLQFRTPAGVTNFMNWIHKNSGWMTSPESGINLVKLNYDAQTGKLTDE